MGLTGAGAIRRVAGWAAGRRYWVLGLLFSSGLVVLAGCDRAALLLPRETAPPSGAIAV
jgi:hypothetical protein